MLPHVAAAQKTSPRVARAATPERNDETSGRGLVGPATQDRTPDFDRRNSC